MSEFNQLMASRYADAARRLFGEDLQLGTFAPELAAGITFQSDRPEWYYPLGSRLWTTGPVQVAAAAGNRSKIEIPNLSTNLLIVVDRVRVMIIQAAGGYQLTMDGPAQGTPTQNFSRDSRQQGLLVQSINRIGNGAGGVGGNVLDEVNAVAADVGGDKDFRGGPWVIHPGHNLQLWSTTVNQILRGIIYGYEYNARPEELAS